MEELSNRAEWTRRGGGRGGFAGGRGASCQSTVEMGGRNKAE